MSDQANRTDLWKDWLLIHRHAGNVDQARVVAATTMPVADRLLDAVSVSKNAILLDIGTGDGLVAFRAIERFGQGLKVIFTDISGPLLDHVQELALERRCTEQCVFVHCPASDLTQIPGASVDVVTSRAALAYEPDKPRAFSEILRILKPGGTLSIAEPVLLDEALAASLLRQAVEQASSQSQMDRILPLIYKWKAAQFPDTPDAIARNPLTNYNERSLVGTAAEAGFHEINMNLNIRTVTSVFTSWDAFLATSPHPLAPTLAAVLSKLFTTDERKLFEETLRPVVESGATVGLERVIYMTARKPMTQGVGGFTKGCNTFWS